MKILIKSSFKICFKLLFVLTFTTSSAQAAEVVSNPPSDLHTRALAGSCAACHGSNGNAAKGNAILAGMDKNYFTTQMLAFKNETRKATVMHHHAKGLTEDEINQLATYFAEQKKINATTLTPQKLKASHENE
jgi:cytochrome subunit of sulfide dehydrogenase